VTYSVAACLAVLGALAVDLLVLRTRLVLRRLWWVSYAIVLAFELIADGVLTGRRIVTYGETAIVGRRIAEAPVEDLLFGFAMVLLTLSTWVWLGRRGVERAPIAGSRTSRQGGASKPREGDPSAS
jgi:lycopene cyclase domain-containing protein